MQFCRPIFSLQDHIKMVARRNSYVEDVVMPKARPQWVGTIDPSDGQHPFRVIKWDPKNDICLKFGVHVHYIVV